MAKGSVSSARNKHSSRSATTPDEPEVTNVRVKPPKIIDRRRRASTARTVDKPQKRHERDVSAPGKRKEHGKSKQREARETEAEDIDYDASSRGEATDDGEPVTDTEQSRTGKKRARSSDESAESGGETDEEIQRYKVSKHRRLEHQLDIGRSVPLDRQAARANQAVTPAAPTPDVQPGQQAAQPAPPCTPYARKTNPSKNEETLEKSYSPPTREAVRALKWSMNKYVATQQSFFEKDDADKAMRPVLLDLLKQDKAGSKKRITRAADPFYIPDILRHVRADAPKLRTHVFNVARTVVKEHYELLARKTPEGPETVTARGERVQKLLKQSMFTAADTTTGIGLFEHPAVHALITCAFFDSNAPKFNLGVNDRTADAFRSYPDVLIAFSATMLFAALSEWTTGVQVKMKFDADEYSGAYQALLDLLIKTTTGADESRAFDEKRQAWYKAASSRVGFRPTLQVGDEMNDIILRNRAALRAQAEAASHPEAAPQGQEGTADAPTHPTT